METLHAVRSAERSAQQTMAVEGMTAFKACSGVYFLYNYIYCCNLSDVQLKSLLISRRIKQDFQDKRCSRQEPGQ